MQPASLRILLALALGFQTLLALAQAQPPDPASAPVAGTATAPAAPEVLPGMTEPTLWDKSLGTAGDLWRGTKESAGRWFEGSQHGAETLWQGSKQTAGSAWDTTRRYLGPDPQANFARLWDGVLPTLEETLALQERQANLPENRWFGDDQASNQAEIDQLLDQAVAILSGSNTQDHLSLIHISEPTRPY